MSREPSFEEMNTPITLEQLPHDVLVSMNNHMAEASGRGFARDVEDSAYQMRGIADTVEALRRMVDHSAFGGHPALADAALSLAKSRDALAAYAEAYGVTSTDAVPVR